MTTRQRHPLPAGAADTTALWRVFTAIHQASALPIWHLVRCGRVSLLGGGKKRETPNMAEGKTAKQNKFDLTKLEKVDRVAPRRWGSKNEKTNYARMKTMETMLSEF